MIDSPCTKICKLDSTGRICLGCRRTVHEIATWASLTDDERRAIMKELRKRPLPEDSPKES